MVSATEEKLKDKKTANVTTGKKVISEFGLIIINHGEKPGATSACGTFCSPIKTGPTPP
ncbi:hypothetical protein [Aliicoccus persicus]|uniref:Uncharacterized protein n=1 Tax=Aliicoccus persicus TaxID=930138 RepID=A0A662Z650_9STAP|nr:hypothetical protein [Aliicoccus persicus]SEW07009.1 hypothetical protein SAMN05192557_1468 [Aliicoccus persicus]